MGRRGRRTGRSGVLTFEVTEPFSQGLALSRIVIIPFGGRNLIPGPGSIAPLGSGHRLESIRRELAQIANMQLGAKRPRSKAVYCVSVARGVYTLTEMLATYIGQ